MTVGELIDAYRVTNPIERRRDDDQLARWWDRQLGALPVAQLTTGLIRRHVRALAMRGRSEWTINFYLRFFRRVCAWGVRMASLPVDVCAPIPLGKDRSTVLRVLTDDEERRLCAALGPPYALWVRFALLTGLTQSEQFALRWEDVDFEQATLWIPHVSTGARVTLSADAIAMLRELQHTHPPSVWVFPDLRNPTRPANIHTFYTGRWESALRRANIPRCAWKDLRSTCGVRLAQQGVPVKEIAVFLRQTDLRRIYQYRRWHQGAVPTTPHPHHPRVPVFADVTAEDLQALLARDTTTAPLTVRELARLYAVHQLRDRPSRRNFEGLFRQFWHPWADRPADSLTKKEVRIFHMGLAHVPDRANKAVGFLRALYNWGSRMELVTINNPAVGMLRYRTHARERFLTIEETQRFLAGLFQLPLKPRAYLLLLFLTGARRSEALVMRWQDVEWTTRLWRKPHTKNGTAHSVPLPVQAVELLKQLPRTSDWVFPGDKGQHWSTGSVEKMWGLVRRRWHLDDVRLHDLRRTCASYLAISGENLPTIQNVLNHRSLNPTAIYARLNTKAVDRALQTQADRLCGLVQGPVVLPALTHGPEEGSQYGRA
jgi:integrase